MTSLPRVAVTTGALRVPPTYFVLQHAELLADSFEFEVFARVADIRDHSLGVPVHDATPVGGSFASRSHASLFFGGAQARAINQFAPALVHQHFGTWSEPAIAAARQAGAPLVTTLHGYDVFAMLAAAAEHPSWRRRFGDHMRTRSTRAAYASSSRLLAVSRYLADRSIEGGADAGKLHVHYQGVDTDYFRPEPTPRSAEPSIVFVGAFTELKGPRDLLRASLALAPRLPHQLVLVGDGPLKLELERAAAESPHVTFAGHLQRDEVREVMRRAHALVLPTQLSEGRREAAGLVLLEAQALGVPVVTYASGGAPEMLQDGVTGLVVEERDIAALTDAIRALLELPAAEYRRMSVDARDFVVRERSLAASARELDAHYHDLIG
jgi:glycosyltransferase involved in cell wall biosynthesis